MEDDLTGLGILLGVTNNTIDLMHIHLYGFSFHDDMLLLLDGGGIKYDNLESG